ncbi:MAG: HD domain-containing protein [Bryobacteraceae bacterium]
MKSPYVGGLLPNEVVTVQFIVINKEIRQKKTGEPYLSLQLADKTGEIEAKMWDNVEEVMHTFDRDDFVKAKGLMQLYQKRAQFTIHKMRRLEDSEVDFGDYFPCSDRSPDDMFRELQSIIAGIGNTHLRLLLESVMQDATIAEKFKIAPAAKSIHHACRGGLIEHVLSLCTLARFTAAHYKDVDLDLVLTGAVLHDIGKIEELSYNRSFGYSSEGQLLGHIVIGLKILADKIRKVPDFPPRLRTVVEHLVVSHHGELEFGSPKVPSFPEALLLHQLDNLDSKMESMRGTLRKASSLDADFTGWVPSLERTLLRKEQYLGGVATPVQAKKPASREEDPISSDVGEATADASSPAAESENSPQSPRVAAQPFPSAESAVPGTFQADRAPGPPRDKGDRRPSAPTLFGEKLQAVLGPRK